jgi:oligoendopeptidase F
MTTPATRSTFVPVSLDCTRPAQIEPLFADLQRRPVRTRDELATWILDRGELDAALSECQAELYIAMTCRTSDEGAQAAYASFVETIPPFVKPLAFELDRRQVELASALKPDERRFGVLMRDVRAEVELFRAANVPIQTELSRLSQRYDQVAGAQTVTFDGREQTFPQMARYQEQTDRSIREAAWRAVASRRLQDSEAIEEIFDRMVALRDTVARNAGCPNFVAYAFKEKHRFDYGVRECEAFHRACEEAVVPFCRRLEASRRRTLRVDALRPWDLAVDVHGRAPLRPFEGGRDMMSKAVRAFELLDPRLGAMLAELGDGSEARGADGGACVDLDSRPGKAPGGYQYMRDRSRTPFIFMNAAGLYRDVSTMVHEAGHAFHSMLTTGEPLLAYRHAPIEFCEVASMSMELLTLPHMGDTRSFYPAPEALARATRLQIERAVTLLPWIATIDAFQHWLYTHPAHTRAERERAWLALDERFGSSVSWDGIERSRATMWQRQPHLFGSPFYYIEYGIAQLGALQLWLISLERGERAAVDLYIRGLSQGGSRPLPELFEAAGLTFDFGPETVRRLVDRAEQELAKLPD